MKPQADIAVRAGRLVYVVGPSGAGKDSIIAYARERLGANCHVFARRHITRPADSGGEDHIAISQADFERDRAAGRFAQPEGNTRRRSVGILHAHLAAAHVTHTPGSVA